MTKRLPLPRAAEESRMNAEALLGDQRKILREASAALAGGNTAMALHFYTEALDRNWRATERLREIPARRAA